MADARPLLDQIDVDQLLDDERDRFAVAVLTGSQAQADWHSRAITELETYRATRWPERS